MKILNRLQENLKEAKSKRGVIAIETVIALSVVLMIILLFIGFWLYLYPRIVLEKEVHTLAQQAKVTGGLTNKQVTDFTNVMNNMGYDIYSLSVGTTTRPASDVSKYNGLVNVYPKGGAGGSCTAPTYQNFVKRIDSEKLVITVKVKAQGFIKGPLAFFGVVTQLGDTYNITETVMSERNKC